MAEAMTRKATATPTAKATAKAKAKAKAAGSRGEDARPAVTGIKPEIKINRNGSGNANGRRACGEAASSADMGKTAMATAKAETNSPASPSAGSAAATGSGVGVWPASGRWDGWVPRGGNEEGGGKAPFLRQGKPHCDKGERQLLSATSGQGMRRSQNTTK